MKQKNFPNHLHFLYNHFKNNPEDIFEWRKNDIYKREKRKKYRELTKADMSKAVKNKNAFINFVKRNFSGFYNKLSDFYYINNSGEKVFVTKDFIFMSDIFFMYKDAKNKKTLLESIVKKIGLRHIVEGHYFVMKKFFFGAKECRKFFQIQDNVPIKGNELLKLFQKPKGFDNGDIKYYGHRNQDMDGASRKQKRIKAKEKSEMKDFFES